MSEPMWLDGDDDALGLDNYCEFCDMHHENEDFHANDGEPDRMWGDDDNFTD